MAVDAEIETLVSEICADANARHRERALEYWNALRVADESIRHHLRGDQIAAAMIQPHAVAAIRKALRH